MDQKKLKAFRERLLLKKQEILAAYNKNKSYGMEADGEATQDIADKAANSYTKEFLFSLSNTERELLQMLDEALAPHRGASLRRLRVVRGGHEPQASGGRALGDGSASPARRSRSRASSRRPRSAPWSTDGRTSGGAGRSRSAVLTLARAAGAARRLVDPVLAVVFPSSCRGCGRLLVACRRRTDLRGVLEGAAALAGGHLPLRPAAAAGPGRVRTLPGRRQALRGGREPRPLRGCAAARAARAQVLGTAPGGEAARRDAARGRRRAPAGRDERRAGPGAAASAAAAPAGVQPVGAARRGPRARGRATGVLPTRSCGGARRRRSRA